MCGIFSGVIVGGIVGGGVTKLRWRRPFRAVIREGMRAQRKLAKVATTVQAEAKQLIAEAREELDHPDHVPHSPSDSKS
jgi:hypothetical protein